MAEFFSNLFVDRIFEEEGSVPEFTELLSRMKVVNAKGESEMSEDQWEAASE